MGIVQDRWASITGAANVIGGAGIGTAEDLPFLKGSSRAGKLRTVIDRRYSLSEIGEAHRYLEVGHKRGHVVIVLGETNR
jgi:NADPH:quinone reductase-like Zn-dependent oxidoreductase